MTKKKESAIETQEPFDAKRMADELESFRKVMNSGLKTMIHHLKEIHDEQTRKGKKDD